MYECATHPQAVIAQNAPENYMLAIQVRRVCRAYLHRAMMVSKDLTVEIRFALMIALRRSAAAQ